MNKTKLIGVVVIIILVAIFITNKNSQTDDASLTVGLLLPLSGDYAAAGENMQKGMELALKQYQEENPEASITVVIEDDGGDTKKGVTAYKKLVDLDKIDILMMLSTNVIDAIYEDATERDIVVIQLGVQTVGIEDDNIFQFSPAAEAPIGHLAKYLDTNSEFNSGKVAVIYDNAAAQISFFETFDEYYTNEFTPFIVNGKGDLRGYATKIANGDYDSVVVIQTPENGALVTKEILSLDTTPPSFVYDAQLQTGFGDYERVLGDIMKIEGAKSMWFKEGNTKEFKEAFSNEYNEAPGFLSDFAYDMINVGLNTYDGDHDKWVDNVQNTNISGGVSGSISFDENGVRIQPMIITQITDGELSPME